MKHGQLSKGSKKGFECETAMNIVANRGARLSSVHSPTS